MKLQRSLLSVLRFVLTPEDTTESHESTHLTDTHEMCLCFDWAGFSKVFFWMGVAVFCPLILLFKP